MADNALIESILYREDGTSLYEQNWRQSGYDIFSHDRRFYAIPRDQGPFDHERVKRKDYGAPVFEADTAEEMYDLLSGTPASTDLKLRHLTQRLRSVEALVKTAFRSIPPGHYYSPLNAEEDIRDFAHFDRNAVTTIPGVAFDVAVHNAHLQGMIEEYASLPLFPKSKTEGARYFYDNDAQWYFDAMVMRHFVRQCRPRRIVEIGGGVSTAAMMDAADALGLRTKFTTIEPDPSRIQSLLSPADLAAHTFIKDKVQNVPVTLFDQLEAGDILFIDSSHVSKFRSDVNHNFFEILPRIKPGVFIHIHDIGYPFEYSAPMLEQVSWNEAYMLRAFLMFNPSFRIEFWTAYASHFQGDLLAEKMPLCRQWPGGSFWMSRQ